MKWPANCRWLVIRWAEASFMERVISFHVTTWPQDDWNSSGNTVDPWTTGVRPACVHLDSIWTQSALDISDVCFRIFNQSQMGRADRRHRPTPYSQGAPGSAGLGICEGSWNKYRGMTGINSWRSQKLYVDFQLRVYSAVSAPNPCIVQESNVIGRYPWASQEEKRQDNQMLTLLCWVSELHK